MKKWCALLLLLAVLPLAACGRRAEETPPPEEVPPAADIAAPETPPDLPEGASALTAEEIGQVNEAFAPYFTDEKNVSRANPLSAFFTCFYQCPEEIDLSAFLEYWPLTEEDDGTVGPEEYAALTELESWSFERDRPQEDMPVPIHRYPGDRVDDFLTEHAGVKTEALAAPWTRDLYWLEDFRAYYNTTSDFGPGIFVCESGWYTDREARLTGGSAVLTLRKEGDRWLFQSFLPEGRPF